MTLTFSCFSPPSLVCSSPVLHGRRTRQRPPSRWPLPRSHASAVSPHGIGLRRVDSPALDGRQGHLLRLVVVPVAEAGEPDRVTACEREKAVDEGRCCRRELPFPDVDTAVVEGQGGECTVSQ